jgi:hypothetical protein
MSASPNRAGTGHWLTLEASATGLAYAMGLCWAGVALVASFRPGDLSAPYWGEVPTLRADTCGITAFFAVAVLFAMSEFLRLHRRRDTLQKAGRTSAGAPTLLMLATSETVAVLATGVVSYLSINAVTHPGTLDLPATHLAPYPTEGTLRVVALFLSACSVAVLRYLLAGSGARPLAARHGTAGMATGDDQQVPTK